MTSDVAFLRTCVSRRLARVARSVSYARQQFERTVLVVIETTPFQTKARTVDHLGREQIADCPTAISELWKNAYDAYASRVELNIYDGDQPVAAIVDNGHGMNREEIATQWLVMGSEEKASGRTAPVSDRNGLRVRERHGQKGIGRLSCANLGPVFLLVSKRTSHPFVAVAVDWRLFENLFLNLSDIRIPVAEFINLEQLLDQFPILFGHLSENVTGGSEETRRQRILSAWEASDRLYHDAKTDDVRPSISSEAILSALSDVSFEARHFQNWPVWTGDSDHGTALFVSHLNYDLTVHVHRQEEPAAEDARKRFFETLSSFVDPFMDRSDPAFSRKDPQFSYAAQVWRGDRSELIVSDRKNFSLSMIDGMEHVIEGSVDEDGVFEGRVRAFGEWVQGPCVIDPPKDLELPRSRGGKLGPFSLYIATMEFRQDNSTHPREIFTRLAELAKKYAGFMIFRDGLRVLPYGRTDNDFFEIESRRSMNVGREFWNHRQMFGRIAISRVNNPNLKDKAGREGLIDNRAAKTFKGLVENILMESARRYFGTASKLRQELLPKIADDNAQRRADEARQRLRKRHRQEFRNKLRQYSSHLSELVDGIEQEAGALEIETVTQISTAREWLQDCQERLLEFRLPAIPKDLGTLERPYADYRATMRSAEATLQEVSDRIGRCVDSIELTNPRHLLEEQSTRHGERIRRGIRKWKSIIEALQRAEAARIRKIAKQQERGYDSEAIPLLHRFDTGEFDLPEAWKQIDKLKHDMEQKNEELFSSYAAALESLQESIDLEHLAVFGMEELADIRMDLERLNSLAQLGIAVEVLDHELQAYDDLIGSGLGRLPEEIRLSAAVKDIELGYEGLTDQLRFLSPLRLAGQRVQEWVSGKEIADYVGKFFRFMFAGSRVSFSATDDFRRLRVFDQRSRLYAVFINLVNNSIYWLAVSDQDDRRIVLDVMDSHAVVSDNGPGVDPEDVDSLFTLFFTRKLRGGRGVGLYLARANLAAGGHRIRYEANGKPLPGATFVVEFKGAEFDVR